MSNPKDIFGVEAKVGHKIAAGMSLGQSSVLRVGEVIKITENDKYNTGKPNYTLRVKWTHNGSDYKWGVKESNILIKPEHSYAKFVVLDSRYVSLFPPDIERDDD
jgi:hypothetical protein